MHDLDTCEVTVDGDELNPAQESLEVDTARLQQKGIAVSASDLGVVFTGERAKARPGAEREPQSCTHTPNRPASPSSGRVLGTVAEERLSLGSSASPGRKGSTGMALLPVLARG